MKKITPIIIAIILTLLVLLTACGSNTETPTTSSNNKENKTLKIYTTLFPIEDFTKKIGGEHVEVTNIIPVGADAHSFEPTPKTMVNIAKGDAFIYNGAGMEGYVESITQSLQNEKVVFVEASQGIELIEFNEEHDEHEEENHEEHGEHDMHLWLDPIRAITLADTIKQTLIELKPEAKEDFEENFTRLKQELETLDQEFANMVEEAPNHTFIVSHAAFGYWTDRYDLQQIGISGLSPSNEPSQKQLQEMIEYANEYNIQYVLFEQNVTSKVAKALKNEIGADALQLHDISVLTEEDVKNKEDYFSLMRSNIETLRTALQ
ncbi:metal ABC transporter solute-binding protein, Zn/Mn family [Bacillus taeanensis]|uniref:Adhesin n=1 Tax=Bacillus taeanensis TaxID=273032 RepID=A0A366XZ84_9BACI|nr:zinc ABC transporter substrate-binding protein [Bacillus taeanensis]RBW71237.1 adhesin [Bacillus taeanensis]